VAVNRPTSFGVAEDASMINKWRRALICGAMELDQDALYLQQIALKGIQESARL